MERINIEGCSIKINNHENYTGLATEFRPVLRLEEKEPTIQVFEDDRLWRSFKLEALTSNPDLSGQFFHCSIRILENSGVMIDGILSSSETDVPKPEDEKFEGLRFQPFYLSDAVQMNQALAGKGLFERGLHFSGRVTPTTIRSICVCDVCKKSFTLHHVHSGFSNQQYFYSQNSRETLLVPQPEIEEMPAPLQSEIDPEALKNAEQQLPVGDDGAFKYYNPLRCPHCLEPFIDFETNKTLRPNEYYGNKYINQEFKRLEAL